MVEGARKRAPHKKATKEKKRRRARKPHESAAPGAVDPAAADELPPDDLQALRAAAARSPDGKTVALVFGTVDFVEIILNWCLFALRAGVRWFVVVAMDTQLHETLAAPHLRSSDQVLLLPRVRSEGVTIDKLTVIGERQRFGLRVLEAGLNVVHSDADALWLRDPTALFAGGDITAERIWGKPLSVVGAWGAAICTGFYFLRATPAVVSVAREVQAGIAKKRRQQPGWQASDQYYINTVLHAHGVSWEARRKMAGQDDFHSRMYASDAHRGNVSTPMGSIRLKMLPHGVVPRACPVLNAAERAAIAPSAARGAKPLRGKALLWKHLLDTSSVLHCFPPGGSSAPGQTIFMGHPRHTAAELGFQQTQGLWMLHKDWRLLQRVGQRSELVKWLDAATVAPNAPLRASEPSTPLQVSGSTVGTGSRERTSERASESVTTET